MCVFLWLGEYLQMCVLHVPDLTAPKLWLWSGESSRLVEERLTNLPKEYIAFGVFDIHCVFQLDEKK